MANKFQAMMSVGLAGATVLGCRGGVDSAPTPSETSFAHGESRLPGPIPIQVPASPLGNGRAPTTEMQTIVDAASADAARRTGMPVAQLVVASAESVVWADGSLGCPAPGMSYTMALVPGYRVRIRAGMQSLDYHASNRGYLLLCPAALAVDPAPVQSS